MVGCEGRGGRASIAGGGWGGAVMAFVRQHGFWLHTQAWSLPAAAAASSRLSCPLSEVGERALKYFGV